MHMLMTVDMRYVQTRLHNTFYLSVNFFTQFTIINLSSINSLHKIYICFWKDAFRCKQRWYFSRITYRF